MKVADYLGTTRLPGKRAPLPIVGQCRMFLSQLPEPVFRLLGSAGGERNEDILFGALLFVSFVIALAVSFLLVALYAWIARRSAKREA